MRFTKLRPRTRLARILAAAVCALGIALPLSAALPVAAANAVSCTPYSSGGNWYVNWGCQAVEIPASHACAVMNGETVDGIQAVQCADLWASNNSIYSSQIWGEGEFYCQGPSGYAACGGMNVNVGSSYAEVLGGMVGVGYTNSVGNFKCNPDVGACGVGREYVSSGSSGTLSNFAQCWQAYTWDPKGNVIAIDGVAIHSNSEVDSHTLRICFNYPS